jgi:mRNA interferase RelE/StbE
MKRARYTADVAKSLKRHREMEPRIRWAVEQYASNPATYADNVRQLVGSSEKRLRVGDFRVIFEESKAEILVTKVGPRGNAYR